MFEYNYIVAQGICVMMLVYGDEDLPFIEIKDLTHVYHAGQANAHEALSRVSLTVEKGEFVAVLGENGCGKSTLAKHINALLLPSAGVCLVDGMDTADMTKIWDIRQKVGMVFQNPDNQIIASVVEEDVAFGPENLGVPRDEIKKRVDEALKAVDMERYRAFAPHLLSGGQKQRIAIAGALAMQTTCLVLDEPTAMLDPKGREEVLTTVRRLNREHGITVIYITHFMEEAAEADRVVVMDKGKIFAEGTPSEIFARVEDMKKLHLDVPMASALAWRLRKMGVELPEGIVQDEELVEALCQLK